MKEAKGVQIGAGFSLRSSSCLDDRQEFDTLQDLIDFPETSLPSIITAVVLDTGIEYSYNKFNTPNVDQPELKKWRIGGSGSGSGDSYTKSELDQILGKDPVTGNIGTNVTELQEAIGKDAVVDDSDPNNIIEVSPATGMKKEIADLKEQIENADGGTADKVDYTNNYGYNTVEDALNDILEKLNYVKPSITSFTITPSDTQYEIGSTVSSLVFNWTLNKAVTSQSLTDCTVTIDDRTATYNNTISSTKTFTLNVSDGKNSTSASATISFVPRVYWGGAEEPTTYDDAFILSLPDSKLASDTSGIYTVNADGTKYGYLVIPVSFGEPAVKISGFDTELDLVATIEHTNNNGHKQDYNVYRSFKGLGVFDMDID